jgi:hypothetical protein
MRENWKKVMVSQKGSKTPMKSHYFKKIQLNEYETVPDFLQLSQNMTSDCLFTFVFFPILTRIYLFCAENCSERQNKTIFGTKQVNSRKNEEKHKSNN